MTISDKGNNFSLDVIEFSTTGSDGNCVESNSCSTRIEYLKERLAPRFFIPTPHDAKPVVPACISISSIQQGQGLNSTYRRHARNAFSSGFWVEEFSKQNFITDIYEVNTSAAERSGKPLSQAYKKTVTEMGGIPIKFQTIKQPECKRHWDAWFGVFMKTEKRKLSRGLQVDQKLVAYSNVRRNGDLIQLNLIMGHQDFLKHNVMKLLVREIYQKFASPKDTRFTDAVVIFYAGYYQGGPGLQNFKRNSGFEPILLALKGKHDGSRL